VLVYLNMICFKFIAESGSEKNFENRLTFGEVIGKSLVSCFFSDSQWRTESLKPLVRFRARRYMLEPY